jgi:hypothetical protein
VVAVSVGVSVSAGTKVWVLVGVETTSVAVWEAVGVALGGRVEVGLGDGTCVAVSVGGWVPVGVQVGSWVRVAVSVGVIVGVSVQPAPKGVGEIVRLGRSVRVAVRVAVMVAVRAGSRPRVGAWLAAKKPIQ